jgi:hypothetical protein
MHVEFLFFSPFNIENDGYGCGVNSTNKDKRGNTQVINMRIEKRSR